MRAARARLVVVPASKLEDLVSLAESAAVAMDAESRRCDMLIDSLRASCADIRLSGVLEPSDDAMVPAL